ncbi:MAG TPA: PolC-type DNA polymerase III [Candidatus Faecimorpha stercoravium]|nr:PolC-type DNA polymerase III [Candidatus Faecimorpha stercoravium]
MQAQKRTVEDYFGKWIEDEGQLELASLLEVQEIRVKRQERVMCIQTKTSHLFSPVWCNTLQGAIQEGMQDQLRVSLEVQYKPKNQEDIWEDAWDMALDTERHLHPMLVSILSSPKRSACRAGQVEIKLPASQARLLRHSGILQRLEADMRQITGSHTQIHLQEEAETPDLIQQQEEERKKREESILRKMLAQNVPAPEEQMEPQSQAMVEPGELPWDDPVDNWGSGMPEMDEPEKEEMPEDQILLGRRITGKIGELDPLEDKKRYVLHGIVSAKSEREIKGEKTLLQLTLTDYQKEAIVKAFVPNEDYEKWGEKIINGVTLMVKGTAKQDDYLHAVTLIANHITLCQEEYPIDPDVKAAMDQMIIGTPFEAQNERPLRNIEAVSGMVTVQGDVILHEANEDRSGNMSLIIDITDYTGSIPVYAKVDKERYKVIASDLKAGKGLEVYGEMQDDYKGDHRILQAKAIRRRKSVIKPQREDNAPVKRVELHMHTKMSEMDAVSSPTELVQQAARWGHPAVAITDHGVVQGFPEAMEAAEKLPIKVIYGVEAYLVDDLQEAVRREQGQDFSVPFVVFDIETTGFNKERDHIIEIGAVKVQNGETVDTFSTFVNPGMPIPEKITELTSITDEQVQDAPSIEEALPQFLQFCEGAVWVAHNAGFDSGFIETKARDLGLGDLSFTVVDTLALARGLYNQLKRYTLDAVCKHLGISLENHHRAVDDAGATAEIFKRCLLELAEQNVEKLSDINPFIMARVDVKRLRAHHAIILVQNLTGLRNLYELISIAHLQYFYRVPRIPKSELNRLREGLLLGTACEAGELYQAVLDNDGPEVIENLVNYYDYLEIQPLCNNEFMVRDHTVPDMEALKDINRRIIELGEQYHKPVVATCDVHFMNPEDGIYRKIILKGKGFDDADQQAPLYLRTTEEMLEEFSYLGEEMARKVVIDNPVMISEKIEKIKPIPDGTFTPEIPGANDELVEITHNKAKSIYGDPLPEPVQARLDRELTSIIKNGFASLYIIAQRLVWHSNADGYVVGSRGSVGSSFVATMAGITEVNPLKPHYYCKECKYSEFDSEEIRANAGKSGFDLPDKVCPHCGSMLMKEGHDIPFETFLGFDGDKEPDIDLNFSGEYQPRAHAFTEELFGKTQVFRAGTMGGLADKTAYGYVKKYVDEHHMRLNRAEINRLVAGCTGVRRTTGQHPGGQMVVPKGYSIYQFCPVQYPANKAETGTITTHFDYHQLHGRLLKLDILGHDDPTMIRMLMDLTGVDATTIPVDNKEVLSLFLGTEALGVTPEQIGSPVGTYGVPEFGTRFVRQMLVDTKPQCFSDLVRISGLSHGTDVWNNNAQDLIRDHVATISEVICTRDDIMTYLIRHHMDNLYSFKTMEAVRKGKGLKPEDEQAMREAGVPEWYIKSCQKIKYLFPKGHATAYVMMALRVAYYKVFYKEAYYAAFFSIRAKGFDYELMCQGEDVARNEKARLEALGKEATEKEKDMITTLELVIEAYCRGIQFEPISLEKSGADRFKLSEEGHLIPPFTSLNGMGATAAKAIVDAREEGEFRTIDVFCTRAKVSKTTLEQMRRLHILDGMPESMQMSLF